MKHLLTRSQAAARLGLQPATLRGWSHANPPRGPACIKLGHTQQARTLYREQEIDRWLADPARYEADRRRAAGTTPTTDQNDHDHDPTKRPRNRSRSRS